MNEKSKRCPYCDELIRANAIKCKHCGSMLNETPTPTGSTDPLTYTKQALAEKYEILEEIGRGGMAVVYKAVQKNLNRTVALKVVHQNLVHDQGFLKRFHREAQLGASLSHNNIVHIYDEGEASGVHFMAMEYLEGTDLHKLIHSKGKLSVDETIKIIAPITEALDYAHSEGLIHRDIKSSNIILSKGNRPVITDFGIAHAVSGTKLTKTGTVIGTPEYMSPEQAEGEKIDGRSDLYSLGVVMYECLTGKVPFKGDNPVTTIYKILHEQPQKAKTINTAIPKWLESVIEKTLSKNPKDRFQSGADIKKALNKKTEVFIKFEEKTKTNDAPKTIKLKNNEKSPVSSLSAGVDLRPPITNVKEPSKTKSNIFIKVLIGLVSLVILIVGIKYITQDTIEVEEKTTTVPSTTTTIQPTSTVSPTITIPPPTTVTPTTTIPPTIREEPNENVKSSTTLEFKTSPTSSISSTTTTIVLKPDYTEYICKLIYIMQGSFDMGSDDHSREYNEQPAHVVFLSGYYIGKYEVTFEEFDRFCEDTGRTKPDDQGWGRGNRPVINVSWYDAEDYCKWLSRKTGRSFRLPTEAEWENAAKGGNNSRGYNYSGSDKIDEVAWYVDNSGGRSQKIGTKKPNEIGIYDLSGNVWEWCKDWFDRNYYKNSPKNNPKGPVDGEYKVLRGGSFIFEGSCKVTYRNYEKPNKSANNIGFRYVEEF